jgi:transposase
MLSLPAAVRIWLCTKPADMRRSFDGLAALVRDWIGGDPLSGEVFVFRNKSADRVKLLLWEEDGFVIFYKRLEEGTFHFPVSVEGSAVQVRTADLLLLLTGVELASVRRHKRYYRPATPEAVSAC